MISKLEQYRLKKMDIKKLESENRYYDICEKYPLSCNYKKMMNFESVRETGKKYNSFMFEIRNLTVYKNFNNLKYRIHKTFICSSVTIVSCLSLFTSSLQKSYAESYENNKEIIIEHDKKLEEYASRFDTSKMSDVEIIVTVMNDIRSSTQYGFDYDVEEIVNYNRLVLNDSNNIGVCRHMSDQFTTIMNMINPEFEAHNLYVNLNSDCNTFKTCSVDQPISKKFREELTNNDNSEQSGFANEIIGNHMVSILKSTNDDYYLVVDVTNPSIGILKDGKIYMFNSNDYSFIEYRPIFQYVLNGDNSFGDINKAFILSYFQNVDVNELNLIYGLDSQNKVLEKIKNKK